MAKTKATKRINMAGRSASTRSIERAVDDFFVLFWKEVDDFLMDKDIRGYSESELSKLADLFFQKHGKRLREQLRGIQCQTIQAPSAEDEGSKPSGGNPASQRRTSKNIAA